MLCPIAERFMKMICCLCKCESVNFLFRVLMYQNNFHSPMSKWKTIDTAVSARSVVKLDIRNRSWSSANVHDLLLCYDLDCPLHVRHDCDLRDTVGEDIAEVSSDLLLRRQGYGLATEVLLCLMLCHSLQRRRLEFMIMKVKWLFQRATVICL